MHSCFRSVSSIAYKIKSNKVTSYLVFATISASPVRPVTIGKRFSTAPHRRVDKVILDTPNVESSPYFVPPLRLLLPERERYYDPCAWVAVLERGFPEHLRDGKKYNVQEELSSKVDGLDLSYFLIQARKHAGIDLLKHLALSEGRWSAALWVIEKISQLSENQRDLQELVKTSSRGIWRSHQTLLEATNSPIWIEKLDTAQRESEAFATLTASRFDISNSGWNLRRGGLGQIWHSLGSFVLAAIHDSAADSRIIMENVRRMLAALHHANVVPESVYKYTETRDAFTLMQPPTLHLLSSRILESLSDAAWNAHQASGSAATTSTEIEQEPSVHTAPGAMYKVKVLALGPEVWLELILWSCLHGPWVQNGVAILNELANHPKSVEWSLIFLKDMISSSDADWPSNPDLLQMKSYVDAKNPKLRPDEHQEDRRRVQRTVSAELIAAYVDALMNTTAVGVGVRGVPVVELLQHVKMLKSLLDRSKMGLGALSWDAVIVRLLESEGVAVERDPQTMLGFMELAQPYYTEAQSVNAPSTTHESRIKHAYFLEPTTAPLGLLHRIIRAYIAQGDFEGTLKALHRLQILTDRNKMESIEQFSAILEESKLSGITDEIQSAHVSLPDFPNFHPTLPPDILASILDLATKSNALNFGRWLLYSDDIDGPMISTELYPSPALAGSLIRFAAATNDRELMKRVIKTHVEPRMTGGIEFQLPFTVSLAFYESQVAFRKWDSVENLLAHLQRQSDGPPTSLYAVILVRELLRMRKPSTVMRSTGSDSFNKGCRLLKNILHGIYGQPKNIEKDKLMSIIGVLSTASEEWGVFCSPFLPSGIRQPLKLPTPYFDRILQGVVDVHGSLDGLKMYKKWCREVTAQYWKGPRIDAGVRRLRAGPPLSQYFSTQETRILVANNTEEMVFIGKVRPSVSTIKTIIQRAQQEKKDGLPNSSVEEIAQWAIVNLWALGLGYDDIILGVEGLRPFSLQDLVGALSPGGQSSKDLRSF